ncbi:MAG: DUF3738 domain-containing protein [Nibricoccus sp.]
MNNTVGQIRIVVLFIAVVLLVGCRRQHDVKSFEGIGPALEDAIRRNDVEAFNSLFEPISDPDVVKERIEFIHYFSAMKLTVYVTDNYPFWEDHHVMIPKGDKLVFLAGADGDRAKMGTTTASLSLAATKINGSIRLVDLEASRDPQDRADRYEFCLTTEDRSEVYKHLGKASPHTFESQFNGRGFTSYSMDDLASTLAHMMGFRVVNETHIEGDYNFTILFYSLYNPSQVKIALRSVGLDLVLKEKPNQALLPATTSAAHPAPPSSNNGRSVTFP